MYPPIPKNSGLNIPKKLWHRIVDYYKDTTKGIIKPPFKIDEFPRQRIENAKTQLDRILSLQIEKNQLFLDAGCGLGIFAALATLSGYKFYGYDVDKNAIDIAHDLFNANGLPVNRIQLIQREVPFKKMKFDIITSFEVVEHVADLDFYLNQLSKVVTPNGQLFIETPNYLIPYEPHFYVFLPPGPKYLKWVFCRLSGRTNYDFFNSLNFVTPKKIEGAALKAGFKIEKNLGIKEGLQQVLEKTPKSRSKYVQKGSFLIRLLKLDGMIKWLAKKGLYTPLVYIFSPSKKF